jgi:hypothetical protein
VSGGVRSEESRVRAAAGASGRNIRPAWPRPRPSARGEPCGSISRCSGTRRRRRRRRAPAPRSRTGRPSESLPCPYRYDDPVERAELLLSSLARQRGERSRVGQASLVAGVRDRLAEVQLPCTQASEGEDRGDACRDARHQDHESDAIADARVGEHREEKSLRRDREPRCLPHPLVGGPAPTLKQSQERRSAILILPPLAPIRGVVRHEGQSLSDHHSEREVGQGKPHVGREAYHFRTRTSGISAAELCSLHAHGLQETPARTPLLATSRQPPPSPALSLGD